MHVCFRFMLFQEFVLGASWISRVWEDVACYSPLTITELLLLIITLGYKIAF